MIVDGTNVDYGASSSKPDSVTKFTTYLKVESEDDGEAQFKGYWSIINTLPPQIAKQLSG